MFTSRFRICRTKMIVPEDDGVLDILSDKLLFVKAENVFPVTKV